MVNLAYAIAVSGPFVDEANEFGVVFHIDVEQAGFNGFTVHGDGAAVDFFHRVLRFNNSSKIGHMDDRLTVLFGDHDRDKVFLFARLEVGYGPLFGFVEGVGIDIGLTVLVEGDVAIAAIGRGIDYTVVVLFHGSP
jgi:hypothetical protein